MNPIDLACIVLLGIGFVWGFSNGFIYSVFSLIALLAGALAGGKIGAWLTPMLFQANNAKLGMTVLFIAIFTLVYFIIRKLSYLVMDLVEFMELEWLDGLLGGVIGFFLIFLIVGVVFNLFYQTGWSKLIPNADSIQFGTFISEWSGKIIRFLAGQLSLQNPL